MAVRGEEISRILEQQIQKFDEAVTAQNVGTVVEVGDGIARVWGLSNALPDAAPPRP